VNGKRGIWGHAIGGMGAITQAMAAEAQARGVEISTASAVSQVLTRDGRATGVVLEDGTELEARLIVSNLNPKLLFLDLIAPDALEEDFRTRIERWKCASGTFRMNVALSELPDFSARPGTQVQPHHRSGIVMAPSLAYMDRAHQEAREHGWSRAPIVEMRDPRPVDAARAPEGMHVASRFCQPFNPVLPDGRSWDNARETAADLIIDTVSRYAPNFKSAVIARQILSPLDLERTFGLVG